MHLRLPGTYAAIVVATNHEKDTCYKVTPQSAAKTTRIILDCYMYGQVSQFLLRVWNDGILQGLVQPLQSNPSRLKIKSVKIGNHIQKSQQNMAIKSWQFQ